MHSLVILLSTVKYWQLVAAVDNVRAQAHRTFQQMTLSIPAICVSACKIVRDQWTTVKQWSRWTLMMT